MGFLTWLRYACTVDCAKYSDDCLSDDLIRRTVDALASRGFQQAGYQYIIIDDCWPLKKRDPATLDLVPDSIRFPHGMKALGDYVRSKGFKFGIYLDYGTLTCGTYPGSLFFMEKDLKLLRTWGVEYIKMDGCYASQNQYEEGHEVFSQFINMTGHPIAFSCEYPLYFDWEKKYDVFDWSRLQKNCNLWRMYTDIVSSWQSVLSIINLYKKHGTQMKKYAAPGSWNDPDMVVIGNGGLSPEQERVQFGMWAILAAPLMLSTNVSTLTDDQVTLLQNKVILSINQDSLGIQGEMVKDSGAVTAWTRQLSDGKYAIAFISDNTLGPALYYSISLSEMGIPAQDGGKPYTLIDVFKQQFVQYAKVTDTLQMHVPNTGILMFLLR
ncbi:hypothetical protein Ciccas_001726 [Cichlidogyrus casuarinus]|uniref:Alpha-galactosidase n=1 Tax=Cichlidogyrus casuarinus TaxID=1844966 RepID=A0ABD2QJB5_9PLAT